MNGFDRYFYGRFAAARAYLFSRLFLVLVALDAWTLMIGHAGRYGVDGFNVAHFAWLDAILPQPTAAMYVGVLLATGLLALALALGGTQRFALAGLFLLYTLSWAMSMLDSYQHHYFVSTVLLCLVFFPELRASDVHPPEVPAIVEPPPAAGESRKAKAKSKAAKAKPKPADTSGLTTAIYVAVGWLVIAAYVLIPAPKHEAALLCACAAVLAAATWIHTARRKPKPALAEGFGFNLLGATAGILYVYTSIAKMDAGWRDGHTITRISAAKRVFAPLVELAGGIGISEDAFWSLFATSVVPIELTIAVTYLVSVRADSSESRWPKRIALLGWVLAMLLHLGAEAMELEIGWFSYYMMLFACAFLLPARNVDSLARLITFPANFIRAQLADVLAPELDRTNLGGTLAITAGVTLMLGMVGKQLDLPGAMTACLIAAGVLAVAAVAVSLRGRSAEMRSLALGTGAAAALMWLALALSPARWDFYRFLGGDLKRRNEPAAALEAYERGERYAPKGQSRQDQIDGLRKQLGR
ncbi:MAG TPA: hypothetical protein VFG30_44030 [Polyangiales bacterium]|nr:hypothetical protein [Polyangiales bacterium]